MRPRLMGTRPDPRQTPQTFGGRPKLFTTAGTEVLMSAIAQYNNKYVQHELEKEQQTIMG